MVCNPYAVIPLSNSASKELNDLVPQDSCVPFSIDMFHLCLYHWKLERYTKEPLSVRKHNDDIPTYKWCPLISIGKQFEWYCLL